MKYLSLLSLLFIFVSCSSSTDSEETTMEDVATAVGTSFDLANTSLTWTAFKTADKIGVSGSFDEIELNGNDFIINAKTVNSGNPDRDPKLRDIFFAAMSDTLITGSYGQPMGDKIPVTLKMNGVEKTFDFDFMENDSSTVVSGTIDMIADFSGNAAYEAIHKACYELHAGKTWTDVDLKVVAMK